MSYKRNIIIINPKFQFKFTLLICSLIFISSLMYPVTIYDLYEKIISLQPHKLTQAQQSRNLLLMWLALAQIALLGIVFVLSLFISHKIAGPMYKLKNHLINLRSGKKYDLIYFRKGDNFTEIAEELNQYTEHLKQLHEKDTEFLGEVSSYINNLSLVVPEDKKPVIKEILSKIAEMQSRYNN